MAERCVIGQRGELASGRHPYRGGKVEPGPRKILAGKRMAGKESLHDSRNQHDDEDRPGKARDPHGGETSGEAALLLRRATS